MNYPIAFDADGLKSKASLYFERAFAFDSDDPLFAFWCHLAMEHLSRAAVASVSPVLLASVTKPHMLHYALGLAELEDDQIESIPSNTVITLCERFVEEFGPAEHATCEEARRRRNAELHSTSAAMADLPPGWLGRFFAACRVLVGQLGLELKDVLPPHSVQMVERLIVEDAEQVREVVRNAIDAARTRVSELSTQERSAREETAARALRPDADPLGARVTSGFRLPTNLRSLRELPCPACKTTVVLSGEVVSHNPVRVNSNGELVETQIAVPSLLRCPVCELRLEGVAALTSAGLADPVTLTDYPDPVEALNIDISEYQDQFLQSLAEDYAYEDE